MKTIKAALQPPRCDDAASALTPLSCALQHPWLRSQGVAADKPIDSVVLQRMRKLSATNKLKKAALVVMAKSLNPHEINGILHREAQLASVTALCHQQAK